MSADPAEAMHFDGAPLAHVVAYRERQRLQCRQEQDCAAVRHTLGLRLRGGVVSFAR